MNEQDWIRNIREKAEDYKAKEPEGLWSALEKQMAEQVMLPSKRELSLSDYAWRYGGVAAVVALLVCLSLWYKSGDELSVDLVVVQPSSPTEPYVTPVDTFEQVVKSDLMAEANLPVTAKSLQTVSVQASVQMVEKEDEVDACEEPVVKVVTAEEEEVPQQKEEKADVSKPAQSHKEVRAAYPVSHTKRHSGSKQEAVSFSMYADNLTAANRSAAAGSLYQASYYAQSSANFASPSDDPVGYPIGKNPVNDINVMNQGNRVEKKTHHRLPIRFGVNVNIPVAPRWSVETGLLYTILSATSLSGTDRNFYETEQAFHYMGVPLRLNFSYWSNRYLSLYLNGGGMVEKCVYGRVVTDYVMGGVVTSSEQADAKEDRLQLSAAMATGVDWRFAKSLSLYVEPGVGYYFNNHSEVLTVYKEHPFHFDLRLGLRFTLGR